MLPNTNGIVMSPKLGSLRVASAGFYDFLLWLCLRHLANVNENRTSTEKTEWAGI